MVLAKAAGQNPRALADDRRVARAADADVAEAEVAGPASSI
jgi:arginyl-tRNA synthetase